MSDSIWPLTNPRQEAVFADWPLGGNKRGECRFFVEHNPKKGYRVGRVTTGKTKYTSYSGPAVICDGANGRTYIVQFAENYGFYKIWRSDFLSEGNGIFRENVHFAECSKLVGVDSDS